MQISIYVMFAILVIHWVADFIFQDEEWSLGKSKEWAPLVKHTFTYSIMWLVPMFYIFEYIGPASLFVLITFVAHTITDYFTSRIVSKRFADKHYGSSIPNFGAFTIIGFDQVLHYVQLILTYYYLKP